MAKAKSSSSYSSISDSDSGDYIPEKKDACQGNKRKRVSTSTSRIRIQPNIANSDIEDATRYIQRPHETEYHRLSDIAGLEGELLAWFDGVLCVPQLIGNQSEH